MESCTTSDAATEIFILLHGLCRTPRSMAPLEKHLSARGYQVRNIAYPSRHLPIHRLSEDYLVPVVQKCATPEITRIHFVTHSMGGILVRDYFAHHDALKPGRVVMLGPPNQGSEVVDALRTLGLFHKLNGPAGSELGTGPDSTPNRLGPVRFPLGIIAGDRSINWINSGLMIRGANDGKVSVERTKIGGMTDHVVVHATHPLLMRNRNVMAQVVAFLKTGSFSAPR